MLFRVVILLVMLTGGARAQVGSETRVPDPSTRRLELEVEKARLEVDRARFEAEKARWQAQSNRAPEEHAGARVDPLAGRLFVTRHEVRLYRNRQLAGDLDTHTVVEAEPMADASWLRLRYQGRVYEAEADAFLSEQTLLTGFNHREQEIKTRLLALSAEHAQANARREALDEEAQRLERLHRQTVVVIARPAEKPCLTNQPLTEVLVVDNSPGSARAAFCRREVRQLARKAETLEQQVAALEVEARRIESARTGLQQRFANYRLAYSKP
jgi:hypothetical protein